VRKDLIRHYAEGRSVAAEGADTKLDEQLVFRKTHQRHAEQWSTLQVEGTTGSGVFGAAKGRGTIFGIRGSRVELAPFGLHMIVNYLHGHRPAGDQPERGAQRLVATHHGAYRRSEARSVDVTPDP
jgi:hypothetical protein